MADRDRFECVVRLASRPGKSSRCVLDHGLVLCTSLLVVAGAETYLLFVPVLALTLVALVSGLTVITPLLENRVAIFLGEASYSLYLVHAFFLPGQHFSKLTYVLCVVGSIVSSIVLYWFLERPARRIWRQVLGSHRSSNPKPVPYSGVVESFVGNGVKSEGGILD